MESWIPLTVHRKDSQINGRYRSQIKQDKLQEKGYGKRWIVESFMSVLKRTTGSALSARSEKALFVEAGLRVLAYVLRR
ncbi:transposase [Polystyrenella longa]|uniref:transposase n=1 Tax=Polystyrenella longa TaxID=2528007 RepID=UPI0011A912E3|nr:transposase [Polystyrenella longa]